MTRSPRIQPALFTRRQADVLLAVGAGCLRQQDIATRLGVQPGTVTMHLQGIYRKLRLTGHGSLARLAQWAAMNGYADPEQSR